MPVFLASGIARAARAAFALAEYDPVGFHAARSRLIGSTRIARANVRLMARRALHT